MLQSADHEHVGVIPTLTQSGVGEDETHRLFKLKQLLLLSKNQVIGIHVIGFRGLLSRLGVHHALGFLVDRKVAFMRAPSGDAVEIPVVRRVFQRQHFGQLLVVLFLKHQGVLAVLLTHVVIAAVFADRVNEKQRQHLDALGKQRLLFLEVGLDRFPNLNAAQSRFTDITRGLARHQLMPIGESHRIGERIDVGHDKTPVLLQVARQVEQVVVA
ncbi:MAG: hypothetical protein ACD_23C00718G0002 [uncultured bacterium]|nr:MAG: hypothetical protein ACD_23C00718G0002 [uncultured bacterium]